MPVYLAEPIVPAVIEWREGAPYSPAFDDVYFSRADGLAETEHVFLAGNRLAERFATTQRRFTIGETGFGTGLNFLSIYRCWRRHRRHGARLIYVTTERHPLARDDLERAHAAWPELAEEAAWLRAAYPPAVPGFHTRQLPEGVTLLVGWGDALALLASHRDLRCDAWFLDGFAPARNAAMWQPDLLAAIARGTAPGGTLASFTAAGEVRRGLAAVGFEVTRRPGYGRKRHMTVACLPGAAHGARAQRHVAVIGGGIAGAGAARALAERGWRVSLFEKEASVAEGASGNPAAILFPRLHRQWDATTRFYLAGYLQVLDARRRLRMAPLHGMVQLPKAQHGVRDDDGLMGLPARLGLPTDVAAAVSAAQASSLAGRSVAHGGLHFPQGGSLSLAATTAALLDHPSITVRLGCAVTALRRAGEGWRLEHGDGGQEVDGVVLANALAANELLEAALPLTPVAGQTSLIGGLPASGTPSLCYGGALSPIDQQGGWALGSTFRSGIADATIDAAGHDENLGKLREVAPEAAASLDAVPRERWQGWAGVRCVSRDRLPLVGEWEDGLFLSLAHGSRGAVSALLAGEMVACRMSGEPSPVERDVEALLDPRRFRPKAPC